MRVFYRLAALMFLLFTVALVPNDACAAGGGQSGAAYHQGGYPRYLVLRPNYKGQYTGLPAQAYAYGWFGAAPSSESTWHRTYSGTGVWWTYTLGE